jgi:hypothetical protein
MELSARRILEVLREKEVNVLYHANTVRTACSFLQKGKLLSRGVLAEQDLPQTDQQTDDLDKSLGLWFDIFVDGVDIHNRASRRNLYGPVLFCMDLSILEQDWMASLWVTKNNPQHWTQETPFAERYYQSVEEFSENYAYGDFYKMFVLRHVGGVIRLNEYLNEIILDDSGRELGGIRLYDQAVGALKSASIIGGMPDININRRTCQAYCSCQNNYNQMQPETLRKFFCP